MYNKIMQIYTVGTVIVDSRYSNRLCGPWEILTNFVSNNLTLVDRIRLYLENNPHKNVNQLLTYIANVYNYRLPEKNIERSIIFDNLKQELNIEFNFEEGEDKKAKTKKAKTKKAKTKKAKTKKAKTWMHKKKIKLVLLLVQIFYK